MNLHSTSTALTRLEIASRIYHPEEYYQQAAKSLGMDFQKMTGEQIDAFVSTIKLTEADTLIYLSENLPQRKIEEIDEVFGQLANLIKL